MISIRPISISLLALVGLAAGCSAGAPGYSAPEERATDTPSRPDVASRDQTKAEWRRQMSKMAPPKEGCFEAVHPSTEWVEVPCATGRHSLPPSPTMTLRAGPPGNGESTTGASGGGRHINPFAAARVPSGNLSSAEGSFPEATGLTGETSNGSPDDFSLQLNTENNLTSPTIAALCKSTGATGSCGGWVQFVYWENAVSIWYFLSGTGPMCPSGAWQNANGICFFEAPNRTPVPAQPISNLVNMTLTGIAGGATDTVFLTTGSDHAYMATNTSALDLSTSWTYADFNVLGNDSGDQATFDSGTTLAVQLLTDNGTTSPPTCEPNASTTGETNNLPVVPGSCCTFGGSSPGILWTESNASAPSAYGCPAGSCGGYYESCCPGSTCHSGLTCYSLPASGGKACLSAPPPSCGGRGEGCCNNTRCAAGLRCETVSRTIYGHRITAFECE